MEKVKVIELTGNYYGEDCYPSIYDLAGITEWVEVSDDEYEALRQYVLDVNKSYYKNQKTLMIISEQQPRDIKQNIAKYIGEAKRLKEENKLREQKKVAAEEKRLEKLRKKKEEKEKRLLENLKAKYEESIQ